MNAPQSLVEVVSRFLPLTANGGEAHGRCVFCSDERPDSLRVGDTAWRTLCCEEHCVTSSDAAGFLMSWSGCSREDALHQLGNGGLPEQIPVQVPPLRRSCLWGIKALLNQPDALVWIHWNPESVYLGREHFPDRVHLGLCNRPFDDLSFLPPTEKRGTTGRPGEYCILFPINTEASRERMDELASILYANGHKKVRWVDFSRRKIRRPS